jgi:hypothetical protein
LLEVRKIEINLHENDGTNINCIENPQKALVNIQNSRKEFLRKIGMNKTGHYTHAGKGHKVGDQVDSVLREIDSKFAAMEEYAERLCHMGKLHGREDNRPLTDEQLEEFDSRLQRLKDRYADDRALP